MKIIFATWAFAEYQGRILTEMGAGNRLVSYWELYDKSDEIFRGYCVSGKIPKKADK